MELFAKIVCLGSRCTSQCTSVITPLLRLVPGLVWRKENILRKLIRVTIIFVVGLPTLFDLRSQRVGCILNLLTQLQFEFGNEQLRSDPANFVYGNTSLNRAKQHNSQPKNLNKKLYNYLDSLTKVFLNQLEFMLNGNQFLGNQISRFQTFTAQKLKF